MKFESVIGFLLLLLVVSCQKTTIQTIEFVKDGQPKDLELRDMWTEGGGYLQAGETFFLRAEKAIYDDDISIKLKLSVNDSEGHIVITAGDNSFGISNETGQSKEFENDT